MAAAHYTIVQYVPDPIAEERVNIGVLAYSGENVQSRFITRWDRVKSFAPGDITFLKDFARQMNPPRLTQFGFQMENGAPPKLNEDEIDEMIEGWRHSIQFTAPRGSTLTPEELVKRMAGRFLKAPSERKPRARDKRAAISLAANQLGLAVREKGLQPGEVLKKGYPIAGRVEIHQFDLGLANGRTYLGAQALSFEVPQDRTLERDLEATAWAIDDVRAKHKNLPLAVVVLPPHAPGKSKLFGRAQLLFGKLGAELVTEGQVPSWAERTVTETLAQ
jgi:hypothetical protein